MSLPKTVNRQSPIANRFKKFFNFQPKRGFSLIELLVVISIISVLVATGTVSWTNAQQKGRDSRRKSDLKAIQQALELYFQTGGKYPGDFDGWCGAINQGTYPQVKNALTPAFLSTIPSDPIRKSELGQPGDYLYVRPAGSNGLRYELYANLENTKDPDVSGPYTNYAYCILAGPSYNYKVVQP